MKHTYTLAVLALFGLAAPAAGEVKSLSIKRTVKAAGEAPDNFFEGVPATDSAEITSRASGTFDEEVEAEAFILRSDGVGRGFAEQQSTDVIPVNNNDLVFSAQGQARASITFQGSGFGRGETLYRQVIKLDSDGELLFNGRLTVGMFDPFRTDSQRFGNARALFRVVSVATGQSVFNKVVRLRSFEGTDFEFPDDTTVPLAAGKYRIIIRAFAEDSEETSDFLGIEAFASFSIFGEVVEN